MMSFRLPIAPSIALLALLAGAVSAAERQPFSVEDLVRLKIGRAHV